MGGAWYISFDSEALPVFDSLWRHPFDMKFEMGEIVESYYSMAGGCSHVAPPRRPR